MSCLPTYKGKRYKSLEEAKQAMIEDLDIREHTKSLFHIYLKNDPHGNITGFKLYVASIKNLINKKNDVLTKELISLLNNKEVWNTITKDSDLSNINVSEDLIILLKNNPALIDYLKENEDINEKELYNKLRTIMLESNIGIISKVQESEKEKD
nr:hypothetical protein [bacterium]